MAAAASSVFIASLSHLSTELRGSELAQVPVRTRTTAQVAGSVAVPHGVRLSGWFGAEGTIVGDGRIWDQVRFNAFPSKAAFLAMALDPARLAAHADHREPAIADTYTFLVRPRIDRIAASIEPAAD